MNRSALAVLLLLPFCARPAWSLSAAELKIYSPLVEDQEKEVEYRAFYSGKKSDNEQERAFSVGYSPTSFWAAEAYEILHKDPGVGNQTVADAIEVENRFQLAAPGRFFLDSGLLIENEFAQKRDNPDSVRMMPIIEKQLGAFVATANAGFEWKYGNGAPQGTVFSYAGRLEYLLNPYFSPAFEAIGEPGLIGQWQRADTQTHQLGPAFYGVWRWGETKQKLRYSAASLFGVTHGSPDWTTVLRLEFEF